MNASSIQQLIKEHGVDTVSFAAADFHGIARGKLVPAQRLLDNPTTSVNISSYMLMMDALGMPHPSPTDTSVWWPSWEEGYTDLRMVPDPETARVVPWQDRTALLVCDYEHAEGKWALDFMPRALVRRMEARLADLGYETRVTNELEWLLFRETEESAYAKGFQNLTPLSPTTQCYSCLLYTSDAADE